MLSIYLFHCWPRLLFPVIFAACSSKPTIMCFSVLPPEMVKEPNNSINCRFSAASLALRVIFCFIVVEHIRFFHGAIQLIAATWWRWGGQLRGTPDTCMLGCKLLQWRLLSVSDNIWLMIPCAITTWCWWLISTQVSSDRECPMCL